jgi:hypothetical protein
MQHVPTARTGALMNFIAVLLMIAMLATAGVLLTGIAGFLRGGEFNAKYGNKLMQARVGLQLVAVLLLGLLFLTQS